MTKVNFYIENKCNKYIFSNFLFYFYIPFSIIREKKIKEKEKERP